jgi:hypothetical protein
LVRDRCLSLWDNNLADFVCSIMDITHFFMLVALMHYSFCTHWADPTPFVYFKAHWIIHVFVSAILHLAVQASFVQRVKVLTETILIWFPCFVLFASRVLGLVVLGFIMIIVFNDHLTVNELTDRYSLLGKVSLSLGVAGDLLVTFSLCLCLWKHRKSVLSTKHNFVSQIMLIVLQTGLATSISSLFYLLALAIWPHKLIWAGFSLIVPRIYSISLTASLNNRARLRKAAAEINLIQYSLWGTAEDPRNLRTSIVFADEMVSVLSTSALGTRDRQQPRVVSRSLAESGSM